MTGYKKYTPIVLAALLLLIGIACSAGTLLVQAPVPTSTPTKTPRPIFTPTLIPTQTPVPTNTPTMTPVPTDTPTVQATEAPPTEVPAEEAPAAEEAPTNTPVPAETNTPAPPPPPTNTPEPTATPAPTFPFVTSLVTHPIDGIVLEFRITGLAWGVDFGSLPGYQMEVTTPSGAVVTSDISGSGISDSMTAGSGTNHAINFEFKYSPYQAGNYTVVLKKDGQQMAPPVEVTATGGPYTYAHINFETRDATFFVK